MPSPTGTSRHTREARSDLGNHPPRAPSNLNVTLTDDGRYPIIAARFGAATPLTDAFATPPGSTKMQARDSRARSLGSTACPIHDQMHLSAIIGDYDA